MSRPRLRAVSLVTASLTILGAVACSSAAEQPILKQFFTASRLRDNTTLASFSTVAFEPATQGIITSFTITNVAPEQRKPLTLKSIAQSQDAAKAEDAAFNKRKEEYANQNGEALQRIVKVGRDGKLKGKDADVQAAWYKLLDEGVAISRKMTEARRSLAAQKGVVELSVSDSRNPVAVTKYDGELVSKEVTIDAPVKLPSGQTAQKTLICTMQRGVLKGDKGEITGRWIVTGIRDASGSGATPRS
jgi:hypothetical protein